MEKLKVAVIGAGNMGKNHIRSYSEMKIASLCAISDINEDYGKSIAQQYSTEFYHDYREMVAKESPDAVSICVPTFLHFEVAKFCIEAGCHVLLEKPIAMDVNEGQQLFEIAKNKNIKFLVGHIERFNPALKRVKEMIEKGDLGEVSVITTRRVGGFPPQIKDADIAVDLAIHDIDIICYLLNDLPKKSYVNKKLNHTEKRADSVEFFLLFKNASAYVQANWITPVKIRTLSITGTEGYLEMDYVSQKIQFYKSNYEKFRDGPSDFADFVMHFSEPDLINISVAKKEPLKEEILYFLNCIRNNDDIDSSFAIEALKIAKL